MTYLESLKTVVECLFALQKFFRMSLVLKDLLCKVRFRKSLKDSQNSLQITTHEINESSVQAGSAQHTIENGPGPVAKWDRQWPHACLAMSLSSPP